MSRGLGDGRDRNPAGRMEMTLIWFVIWLIVVAVSGGALLGRLVAGAR
jgi:hypothetical protein